jgi:hypothetical protein
MTSLAASPYSIVRANFSSCLINHHDTKIYRGEEVQFHAFLNSALDGREMLVSHPGHLTPRQRIQGIPWVGGTRQRAENLFTTLTEKTRYHVSHIRLSYLFVTSRLQTDELSFSLISPLADRGTETKTGSFDSSIRYHSFCT